MARTGGALYPLALALVLLATEFAIVYLAPPHKAVPLAAGVVGGAAQLFALPAVGELKRGMFGGSDVVGWAEVVLCALGIAAVSFAAHPVCSTVA